MSNASSNENRMDPVELQRALAEATADAETARVEKEALQAMHEGERLLPLIYDNVTDAIFLLGVEPEGEFRFLSVNRAFSNITGVPADQVVGRLVREVIPEPSLTLVLERYFQSIRDRETVHWEETTEYPTGTKHGEVSITPLFDSAGFCSKLLGVVRDVSQRKQAEWEVIQLNADLERRISERTSQLESANRELAAFSYSVSHDLRAPLRHVNGYIDLMSREVQGQLTEKGRRYLQVIADASKEMGQLIDDLLTFSRMGRVELEERVCNLESMVRVILREFEPTLQGRTVEWVLSGLPEVIGDASMLKLVLANLIDNALKFTRPRDVARIEVGTAGMDGDRIVVFVRDNGVGFDMHYVDKLFGVFQRLHRTDEFEGTGIGLANIQRIILRHGGRAWGEGAIDQGATFYFTLRPSRGIEALGEKHS